MSKQETNGTALRSPGRPTIATIAAHMGVSRATVTHVLNGRAAEQRISPTTRQKVLDTARELGYRANAAARAVRAGRSGNVALIQSRNNQYLPRELLFGLTDALKDQDLNLVLTQVSDVDEADDAYLPHTLGELSADGVFINRHVGIAPAYLDRIRSLRVPAIFLNVRQEFDCIHPDEIMGGRIATEFLLRLGHQRIAYVDTGDRETRHFSEDDRRRGYEEAMRVAGCVPRFHSLPLTWQSGQPGVDSRVVSAGSLLDSEGRPTAIIAYEIGEAMTVVHAAHEAGLRVPRDLSIVAFHNRRDVRFFLPFHTISNVMSEIGSGAVPLLLEKMGAPEDAIPARVMPVHLLEGATCLPPVSIRSRA